MTQILDGQKTKNVCSSINCIRNSYANIKAHGLFAYNSCFNEKLIGFM